MHNVAVGDLTAALGKPRKAFENLKSEELRMTAGKTHLGTERLRVALIKSQSGIRNEIWWPRQVMVTDDSVGIQKTPRGISMAKNGIRMTSLSIRKALFGLERLGVALGRVTLH